mmetsp:Transcript_19612/g.49703  ORF Transcript_19612/g.49703 Transcript_19612/m.49703 type:complete len:219 (-) Transcript_19612:313-969(-)
MGRPKRSSVVRLNMLLCLSLSRVSSCSERWGSYAPGPGTWSAGLTTPGFMSTWIPRLGPWLGCGLRRSVSVTSAAFSLSNLRPVLDLKAALGTLLFSTALNAPVIRLRSGDDGASSCPPSGVSPGSSPANVPSLLLTRILVPHRSVPLRKGACLPACGAEYGLRCPLTSYCPGPGAGARFLRRSLTSSGTMGLEKEEEAATADTFAFSVRYRNPLSGS